MEQLIIKALKAACGNRNIKFQVIVQDDQLHIYANHRKDYQPNYLILKENVGAAIASLALERINSFWLYTRSLDQVEPNWQVFVELSTQGQEIEDTYGNTGDLEHLESEINLEGIGNFDLMTSGTTGEAELLLDQDESQKTLLQTGEFAQTNSHSNGDSGLLQDQGLIHGRFLRETDIHTFSTSASLSDTTEAANFSAHNNLAQYCFISNPELLTGKKANPSKTVMRLVKFFHYLSTSDQQQLPPILEKYFREGLVDEGAEISPVIQNWLKQISALDDRERNAFALWLSCYCFEPTATLAEFKTISAQNMPQMNIKQANRATEYSFVSVSNSLPASPTVERVKLAKFQLLTRLKQLLLPGIWISATVIITMLGIINHNSNTNTSAQIPALCRNAIGSPEYCRLAVNLAGEKAIAKTPKNLFPLTEVTESVAKYGCSRYANLKAGIAPVNTDPEITPVISSRGEQVFPHIYVVEAQQRNANQLGKTRVGCVYTTGEGQRSPKKIAADLIPVNWPTEHYQKQTAQDHTLAFGSLTKPINLGLSTIFAALGIAIASRLNLGLKINHTHTIYLVALILGIVQLANTLLMPTNFLGLLGAIAFPILTIAIASLLIKDFQLNWNSYPSIALSVLAILASQFLLYSFCLGLISSLV
ncbi:hypothetical protein C7B62_03455 [Pleurocapsa sp. CCALA 161]|uniref:phage holin family protein n=1 Tax=Pleurocapsa sp. CCALA 161 TaxID=2107688 RepID=UPI000D0719B5|nr:phage holin family protein [Pleurocapsa sp. CCALA 161]PSB11954.1 hypothetical protein C7B62_03455 [Pleurocapsa sp. CCALA 161]